MSNPEAQPKIRRKRYDPNFKRQAVEQWLAGGKSATSVAGELGISAQALKMWKKQLAMVPPPTGAHTAADCLFGRGDHSDANAVRSDVKSNTQRVCRRDSLLRARRETPLPHEMSLRGACEF